MTLVSIFQQSLERFGSRPALIMRPHWRSLKWTYQDLAVQTSQIANFLKGLGLEKGERVILIAPNSPYWVAIFWAVQLNGGVIVPLNPGSTAEFIEKVIKQTESRIILKALNIALPALSGVKVFEIETLPEILTKEKMPGKLSPIKLLDQDWAEIVYTSGTTGDPKGVILTHKNIVSNLKSIAQVIAIKPQDRFLSILPLFHMFEQTLGMLLPLMSGSLIVYVPNLGSGTIAQTLAEHRITKMLAVPEFLKKIMDRIEAEAARKKQTKLLETLMKFSLPMPMAVRRILFLKIHHRFGGKLRTVASGGASLDQELEKKWLALGIHLLQGYGLTETSPVISTNTFAEHKIGSVGKVIPGVKVKIADDGEILVRGPNVCQGYYQNLEKTNEVFLDSWFKTDDQGLLDKDGFLYVFGRKKYMILGPAGENVFPEDIEEELNKVTGVKDSAVIGLERGGRVIIHAVILTDRQDLKKIVERANRKLAPYQRIQDWSAWPGLDFPRSATRKVRKEEVIKWLKIKAKPPGPTVVKITPLTRLLGEVTGLDPASMSSGTNLYQGLNLDSLLRIELVTRIEEEFGSVVEERLINKGTTVRDLERLIEIGKTKGRAYPFKKWPLSRPVRFLGQLIQKIIFYPLISVFVNVETKGLENLRFPGPVIFMANHLSYLDSVVIIKALPARFGKRLAIAAAIDVLYRLYRSVAWLVEIVFNSYPFPRREQENIKAGLDYTGRLLDLGWSILIYPEGRMSTDAHLQSLKRGAGLLATEMEVPVVPVLIKGTFEILPPGKIVPHKRGRVMVSFGKPMMFPLAASYIEATNQIEKSLSQLSKKL